MKDIRDRSTDLSYLQNRYYDTAIGLFISTDPILDINNQRTLNPYSYAGGNPTTWTDPDGLSPGYIYQLERHNKDLQSQNTALEGQVDFLSAVARWQSAKIRNLEIQLWDMASQRNFLLRVTRWQEAHIRNLEVRVWNLTLERNFLAALTKWQVAAIRNGRPRHHQPGADINRLNATNAALRSQVYYLSYYRNRTGGSSHGPGPLKSGPTVRSPGPCSTRRGMHNQHTTPLHLRLVGLATSPSHDPLDLLAFGRTSPELWPSWSPVLLTAAPHPREG